MSLVTKDSKNIIPYLYTWRVIQLILLLIGVAIVGALTFLPELGINLFWNLIIPLAPAIIVLIPGVWRNICPMASAGLLPRHLGFSKRQHISEKTHSLFALLGMFGLLLIVPLRHISLNMNGPMTALMLVSAAFVAFIVGYKYEWKSAWCSGLCPIHPVEKLYGTATSHTPHNAHCTSCEKCTVPCPDSTKLMTPIITNNNKLEDIIGLSMVGGFFGFVWGWYQVPDYAHPVQLSEIINAFLLPLGGFIASSGLFLLLYAKASKSKRMLLTRLFATAAVSCYYWYRIPMLFGWGLFPGQGMLIDLTQILPAWFPIVSKIKTTGFFIWFMMLRKQNRKSWSKRPDYSTAALTR